MAGVLKINVDVRGLDAVQKRLATIPRDLADKALQPALNKTAQRAQAEVNRAIRAEYYVKAEEVRNAISLRRASRGELKAVIDIFGSKSKRGRSANMIHFLAALQGAGVAIKTRGAVGIKRKDLKALGSQLGFNIRRGAGVKQIKGAFIANNGRTVFIREGKARLPIKPLQVIGFGQMFASKTISQRVMAKVDSDLVQEVERAIKMILSK